MASGEIVRQAGANDFLGRAYWCLAEIIHHFTPSRDAPCTST
jgi:hypothetical protein